MSGLVLVVDIMLMDGSSERDFIVIVDISSLLSHISQFDQVSSHLWSFKTGLLLFVNV